MTERLKFRDIIKVVILVIIACELGYSQPRKGRFIDASIGIGVSAPSEDIDITGSGFFAKAEYVMGFNKWIGFRPYAGILITSPVDNETYPDAEVTSSIFLLGGKGRLVIPIPYVAPYIELGVGLSAGTLTTRTPTVDTKQSGIIPHFPVSLGLALGKNHTVEVAFAYYFYTQAEQFNGAALIGMSFPVGM